MVRKPVAGAREYNHCFIDIYIDIVYFIACAITAIAATNNIYVFA
jgi:hypothetical protein